MIGQGTAGDKLRSLGVADSGSCIGACNGE